MSAEPQIVAFCCHYCAFTAADTAGTMRLSYPPNIRIVRLPCSGRVDVEMLLRAFRDGADGVMVGACEIGSCHFVHGNQRAVKRVDYARRLLEEAGVVPNRLAIFHIPASAGPLFARTAREFTERIRRMQSDAGGAEKTNIR